MCTEAVLMPTPQFIKDDHNCLYEFNPDSSEFGVDAQGRECLSIDKCIAPAIQALWDAGIKTTACCCGHGSGSGVVGLRTWEDPDTRYERSGMRAVHELHRKRLGRDAMADLARELEERLPPSNVAEIHPAAQALVRFGSIEGALKEIEQLKADCAQATKYLLNVLMREDKQQLGHSNI